MFSDGAWLRELSGEKVVAYAVRSPRVGTMPKVNAVLEQTEADFVVIPARVAWMAKVAFRLGLHRRVERIRRSLQDLAIVIRPGCSFIKGAQEWEPFFSSVINDVPDLRLDDTTVCWLAEAFVCDYVWAQRKLERGELLTVQRILHRELAETNFRLLHELKLRRGERSFPEARRFELIATSEELSKVSVNALLNKESLNSALELSAESMRTIVGWLAGDLWRWPKI
jgi:hypothetical protein